MCGCLAVNEDGQPQPLSTTLEVHTTLGRPLVDTIKGSRHKNMKELRPGSAGRSEIRILFAFDPKTLRGPAHPR